MNEINELEKRLELFFMTVEKMFRDANELKYSLKELDAMTGSRKKKELLRLAEIVHELPISSAIERRNMMEEAREIIKLLKGYL